MFKRSIATLILSCITMVAIAAQSPVDLLQNVSNQMIDKLKQDQSTIKSNPQHVESLARQIILPHVEITTMSRLALGRDGWLKATPAQKQQFVNQFTTLMIRTYSKALASYSDQTVKFYPIRGSLNGQTQTQVDSKILQPGGPAIPMSYRMVLRGNDWKVYDMSVDGVSMVQSFHSQFAQELNQGGVAGLLNAMVKQNASKEKA
jgi:phospholipid transport system substrate-binding protein